jgi:hypothetical protein
MVGGVSLSRLIIGTNWFLGFSHCTAAKDEFIKEYQTPKRVADVMEVFVKAGVDTVMGLIQRDVLYEAVEETQQRTGKKMIVISTPVFPVGPEVPAKGLDLDAAARILDQEKARGATFCFPHQATTDALVDRCTRTVRYIGQITAMVRERGMIPGLSSHMPEAIVYADESGADVESYIAIYNAMGFLMQVEVDWIARVIRNARKPVMTIKPLAAGQLRPFQGLSFVWNTLRPQDLVTLAALTPREAAEDIELSLAILERRASSTPLQETRSKSSIKT